MSIKLRAIRDRVRMRLRDTDSRKPSFNTIEYDTAICEAYIALQADLPAPDLYTASAFTISAGSDTFALPATVTLWTGNDGGAEYRGDIKIQLVSTGQFLTKATVEELDSFRDGHDAVHLSIPRLFALWEDKTQGVNGRCYPGAQEAQVCNLWARMAADDLRDFIGSGSDDLDDVEAQLSREGAQALVLQASAEMLVRMTPEDAALRKLSPDAAKLWLDQAAKLAYAEACRRHDIDSTGRIERWVS